MSKISLHRYMAERHNFGIADVNGNVYTKDTAIQNPTVINFWPREYFYHVHKTHISIDDNKMSMESISIALGVSLEEPMIPSYVNGFMAYGEELQTWKDFPNEHK